MNVVLFRDLLQEQWASIEVYAERLVNGLRRLGVQGWTFCDVAPSDLHLPRSPKISLYLNRSVVYPLFAVRHQAQINHVLDNSYGHLLYFIDPRRTVVTSHGGTPLTWRQWNREGPAMSFFDWAFRGTLKAARIIIVSHYSKRELVEHYDYDPARVHVVYHGVDEGYRVLSLEQREQLRAQYLRPNESGLILHVGHCAERKNVEGLISAFAMLLKNSSQSYRLLQIGGQFSLAQQQLIARLGVGDHITQLPSMPNRELVGLYNAADVFAFPSLYEGFGIPLIEAMACGTPIVCHAYELFHEVCANAALYADARNAEAFAAVMAMVLNNASLAQDLPQRALERAKAFSWERCARETLAVYQRMVES